MATQVRSTNKSRKRSPAAAAASCAPGMLPQDLVEQARPEDDELAELAKALAHPVRILIVRNLLRIGTCYFGKLADLLPVAPSTASQHLSVLKEAGLVIGNINEDRVCDINETRPCYCVDLQKLKRVQKLIGEL